MKKQCSILVCMILVASWFSGCRNIDASSDNGATTIKVAGSTSVAPLMKALKTSYEKNYSDVTVEIQESGSSAGINATIEGACHIGMSSRDISEEELSKGLQETIIALDGIAVIVHPDNPVNDLSTEQVQAIFSGTINNWKDVGGLDEEIIVVSREEGAGTRTAFEELVGLEEEIEVKGNKAKDSLLSNDALIENSTGAVKSNVAASRRTIGYSSFGTLDESVRAIQVNGVLCGEETVKDNSYVISRPFIICTKGEASESVQHFMDFILSDAGQEIVRENGYITIH